MNTKRIRCAFLAAVSVAALSFASAGDERVLLLPKFTPGDSLRYRIETRTSTAGKTTSPIENPEAATQFKQTVSMVVRLDVLDNSSAAKGVAAPVRLRATYERSSATSESDAYDPQAATLEDQYNHLEGHSIEFTIEPDGKVSNIKGLEDVLPNPSAAQSVRSWMASLSSGDKFPKGGIRPGQKWSNEQPLTGTPLGGLLWHTEATYLRNEPCPATKAPATGPAAPAASNESCAVILTRFEIVRRGGKGDSTPEDYLRNGLRTSGTWTGSGESLDSISLASGMVVSSTQTSSQEMDFRVTSASSGSRMTYKGRVHSESEVMLLPQAPPQP